MIHPNTIESRIRLCRGRPTLPAADVAVLYGVSVRTLLECVQRRGPLPGEYAFVADAHEPGAADLDDRQPGGRLVFTEHGAIAAAYLIGTELALENGLAILRTLARHRVRSPGEPSSGNAGGIVAESAHRYST